MSAEFNQMLNDHLYYDLLKERLEKKNYIWANAQHDEDAVGDIIVPFQSARATSVKAGGGPVAVNDIATHQYVRGSIPQTAKPKIWMSMKFNHEDIINHEGRVKQKSFLGKFLPEQIEDGTDFFSTTLNHMFLNSAHIFTATGDGTAGGVVEIDRIERAELGMFVSFDTTPAITGYITAIDINTGKITVKDARTGGSSVDLQAVTKGTKVYQQGFDNSSNRLSNVKDLLLSYENGGSQNIYGVPKLSSVFTQAVNIDGSDITETNILDKIFDGLVKYRTLTKMGANEVWMSYKLAGSVMKILEQDKGPYKTVPGTLKSNEYGFTEINIFGPKTGALKFVFLPEMDNDVVVFADLKSLTIHSNKGIQKVKSPDGLFYYVVRDSDNGYSYVCDLFFQGDVVISKPHKWGIIHSIDLDSQA